MRSLKLQCIITISDVIFRLVSIQLQIHIRPLLPTDIPQIADFCPSALHDHEFFTFVSPYRDEHPVSHREYFLRNVKQRFYDLRNWLFVAEAEAEGKVVGYSCWKRLSRKEDVRRKWTRKGGLSNCALLSTFYCSHSPFLFMNGKIQSCSLPVKATRFNWATLKSPGAPSSGGNVLTTTRDMLHRALPSRQISFLSQSLRSPRRQVICCAI